TLRWSRAGDNAVLGQITVPPRIRVAIEAYRPWSDARGDTSRTAFSSQDDHRTIFGEQVNPQKIKTPMRNFLLQTDRIGAGAADSGDPQSMRGILVREGHAQYPKQQDREVSRFSALSFDSRLNSPNGAASDSAYSIGFVAMIGDDFSAMQLESNILLQRLSTGVLDQEEMKYEKYRATSGGALGESFPVLNRMLNWSRIYLPEKRLEYAALSRRNDRDTASAPLGWDTFFNAAVSSLINDSSA